MIRGSRSRAIDFSTDGMFESSFSAPACIAYCTRVAVHLFVASAPDTTTVQGTRIAGRPPWMVWCPCGGGLTSGIHCTAGASGDFATPCLLTSGM